ncbi:hypothetical protein ACTNBL_08880 [Enterococcus villorum]|jgi:hypothetical protein|nr:hypothetical protein [Enterococcus villorum]
MIKDFLQQQAQTEEKYEMLFFSVRPYCLIQDSLFTAFSTLINYQLIEISLNVSYC